MLVIRIMQFGESLFSIKPNMIPNHSTIDNKNCRLWTGCQDRCIYSSGQNVFFLFLSHLFKGQICSDLSQKNGTQYPLFSDIFTNFGVNNV